MGFALEPVWPPMFRSRTCDPADGCFIGRAGGEANVGKAPAQQVVSAFNGQVKWDASRPRYGVSAMQHALSGRILELIKACGPLRTSALCCALDVRPTTFSRASCALVDAGVLRVHKAGKDKVYSLRSEVST